MELGLFFDLEPFAPHFGFSLAALGIPAAIPFVAYGGVLLVQQLGNVFKWNLPKPRSFVELAYGYLPLVLAGNLAHYLRLCLGEGGRILPVALATFGLSGEGLPVFVAHPAVIAFLQGITLIFGVILTIILTQKIACQSVRSLFAQHLGAVVLGVCLWAVIVGY
jgi:hypothetical protein